MIRQLVRLTLAWLLLLLLGGGAFLVSGIHFRPADRPVILVFTFAMVTVIAMAFMKIGRSPMIARGFAVAALFWLIVLLGLSSADILTRNLWLVQNYHPQ